MRPKQWKRGGGQQRVSSGVRFIRSPMKEELFIRLLGYVSLLEQACTFRIMGFGGLLVCEHRCFRVSGAPTCELQVCDVERTYYAIEDVEEVVRYCERLVHDEVVSVEARHIAT